MIITLRGSDREVYRDHFDQLYRLRYEVFIKVRG